MKSPYKMTKKQIAKEFGPGREFGKKLKKK